MQSAAGGRFKIVFNIKINCCINTSMSSGGQRINPGNTAKISFETPETLLTILRTVHIHLYQRIGRPHKLSPRNRILLFVLWLRSYPSYHMLSSLYDVSVSTVQDGINICFPIFEEYFGSFVRKKRHFQFAA
jgi:hypothetical protein